MPVITRRNDCLWGRAERAGQCLTRIGLTSEVLIDRFAHELGHRDTSARRSPVDTLTLFLGEVDLGSRRRHTSDHTSSNSFESRMGNTRAIAEDVAIEMPDQAIVSEQAAHQSPG